MCILCANEEHKCVEYNVIPGLALVIYSPNLTMLFHFTLQEHFWSNFSNLKSWIKKINQEWLNLYCTVFQVLESYNFSILHFLHFCIYPLCWGTSSLCSQSSLNPPCTHPCTFYSVTSLSLMYVCLPLPPPRWLLTSLRSTGPSLLRVAWPRYSSCTSLLVVRWCSLWPWRMIDM